MISPAEPKALRELGEVSSYPETMGADFFWIANKESWGVQRKELKDFIASVQDGRLSKEVQQSKSLDHFVVMVEGACVWVGDQLAGRDFGAKWSKSQHEGMIWSLQNEGIWYKDTKNTDDTAATIGRLVAWSEKAEHNSLYRRAGVTSMWGKPDNEDFIRHLVMGLPSVGFELANRIMGAFGCPFGWKISEKQLEQIEGIGKVKAKKIYGALLTAEDRNESVKQVGLTVPKV